MSGKGILAIGSIIIDQLCQVPLLPSSGQGVVVQKQTRALGGCALNAAAAAQRAGGTCTLLAPIGIGPNATFAEEKLERLGFEPFKRALGCDGLPHDNASCICMVEPNGERTMLTFPGIDQFFVKDWFDGIDAARYCMGYVCGYELHGSNGERIVEFFESNPSIELWYAPGPCINSVEKDLVNRINALHPVWHLNEMEALSYTNKENVEEAEAELLEQCGNAAIITQGSKGSRAIYLEERGGEAKRCFAGSKPVKVVDTIGAGDAHVGTLMACKAAGLSWSEALECANEASSRVCLCEGALPENAL